MPHNDTPIDLIRYRSNFCPGDKKEIFGQSTLKSVKFGCNTKSADNTAMASLQILYIFVLLAKMCN